MVIFTITGIKLCVIIGTEKLVEKNKAILQQHGVNITAITNTESSVSIGASEGKIIIIYHTINQNVSLNVGFLETGLCEYAAKY